MSDYISRENALLALDDFLDSEQGYGIIANQYSVAEAERAKKRIMCIPSAVGIDVEKIRHGKWNDTHNKLLPTHKNDEFTSPDQIFYATCSLCGITTNNEGCLNGYRFCPHCGTKMDLKE